MALIAERPSQELIDLVGDLKGTWNRDGSAYCRCPAHQDNTPSLSLRQGHRAILVHCFAGCKDEDVLRALSLAKTGKHYNVQPPQRRATTSNANIQRLWDQSTKIQGTLAEQYLSSRRISFAIEDVRFLERCPHGPKPHTVYKPAVMVAVRSGYNLMAIQRIFLDPYTAKYTQKVMIGNPGGGAWRGPRPSGDTLAIAEGFEDAARFTAIHGIPCWASLGAGRLHQILLPDHIQRLILAEDNDSEGMAAAQKAMEHYEAQGHYVERWNPEPAKDWGAAE